MSTPASARGQPGGRHEPAPAPGRRAARASQRGAARGPAGRSRAVEAGATARAAAGARRAPAGRRRAGPARRGTRRSRPGGPRPSARRAGSRAPSRSAVRSSPTCFTAVTPRLPAPGPNGVERRGGAETVARCTSDFTDGTVVSSTCGDLLVGEPLEAGQHEGGPLASPAAGPAWPRTSRERRVAPGLLLGRGRRTAARRGRAGRRPRCPGRSPGGPGTRRGAPRSGSGWWRSGRGRS